MHLGRAHAAVQLAMWPLHPAAPGAAACRLPGSAAMAALSAVQMEEFERNGAVTIDSPLTPVQLDAAEQSWDSVRGERTIESCAQPGFVEAVAHPFFEAAAKQLLRSNQVHIQETFAHDRPPTTAPDGGKWPHWHDVWSSGMHIDVQLTADDFDATPRREQLVMWLWLTDATAEGGAMRYLPGSHRRIMEHWGSTLRPERLQYLPRTHGLRPVPATPGAERTGREGLEAIPELSGMPWADQLPTAAAATRGQVFIMTGSVLHSAWHNQLSHSRKSIIISWNDIAVPGGFEESRVETMTELYPVLRAALPPSRRHIVPETCHHFVSSYEDQWVSKLLVRSLLRPRRDSVVTSTISALHPLSHTACGYLDCVCAYLTSILRKSALSETLQANSWLL